MIIFIIPILVQPEFRVHKIVIHLQIRLKVALFANLEASQVDCLSKNGT